MVKHLLGDGGRNISPEVLLPSTPEIQRELNSIFVSP
jgi:hypothetical protein